MAALFYGWHGQAPRRESPGHRPPPAARIYLVEVFNGSKQTEEKFAAGEGKQ